MFTSQLPIAQYGAAWIDGVDLHYIDKGGLHRKWTGNDIGVGQNRRGMITLVTNALVYIDADGHRREVRDNSSLALIGFAEIHSDAHANYHGDRDPGHADTHSDGARGNPRINLAEINSELTDVLESLIAGQTVGTLNTTWRTNMVHAHSDKHIDQPHGDHNDFHVDRHQDK